MQRDGRASWTGKMISQAPLQRVPFLSTFSRPGPSAFSTLVNFSQFTPCRAFPALLHLTMQSPSRTWQEVFSGGGEQGPICAFRGLQEMSPHPFRDPSQSSESPIGFCHVSPSPYPVHGEIINHPCPSLHLEPQTQSPQPVSLLNSVFSNSILIQSSCVPSGT